MASAMTERGTGDSPLCRATPFLDHWRQAKRLSMPTPRGYRNRRLLFGRIRRIMFPGVALQTQGFLGNVRHALTQRVVAGTMYVQAPFEHVDLSRWMPKMPVAPQAPASGAQAVPGMQAGGAETDPAREAGTMPTPVSAEQARREAGAPPVDPRGAPRIPAGDPAPAGDRERLAALKAAMASRGMGAGQGGGAGQIPAIPAGALDMDLTSGGFPPLPSSGQVAPPGGQAGWPAAGAPAEPEPKERPLTEQQERRLTQEQKASLKPMSELMAQLAAQKAASAKAAQQAEEARRAQAAALQAARAAHIASGKGVTRTISTGNSTGNSAVNTAEAGTDGQDPVSSGGARPPSPVTDLRSVPGAAPDPATGPGRKQNP